MTLDGVINEVLKVTEVKQGDNEAVRNKKEQDRKQFDKTLLDLLHEIYIFEEDMSEKDWTNYHMERLKEMTAQKIIETLDYKYSAPKAVKPHCYIVLNSTIDSLAIKLYPFYFLGESKLDFRYKTVGKLPVFAVTDNDLISDGIISWMISQQNTARPKLYDELDKISIKELLQLLAENQEKSHIGKEVVSKTNVSSFKVTEPSISVPDEQRIESQDIVTNANKILVEVKAPDFVTSTFNREIISMGRKKSFQGS